MTVAELIEKLRKFDPDEPIYCRACGQKDSDDYRFFDIQGVDATRLGDVYVDAANK